MEVSRHKCLIYEGEPAQQLPVVIPLLLDSLANNWRCLYLADPATLPMVDRALGERGIDTRREQDRGALVLSADEARLEQVFREGRPLRGICQYRRDVVPQHVPRQHAQSRQSLLSAAGAAARGPQRRATSGMDVPADHADHESGGGARSGAAQSRAAGGGAHRRSRRCQQESRGVCVFGVARLTRAVAARPSISLILPRTSRASSAKPRRSEPASGSCSGVWRLWALPRRAGVCGDGDRSSHGASRRHAPRRSDLGGQRRESGDHVLLHAE